MFSNSKEISEIFECMGGVLDQDVQTLIIGGAALMDYGIKDATKDIDIVCSNMGSKRSYQDRET